MRLAWLGALAAAIVFAGTTAVGEPASRGFFFIHVSDVHAYRHSSQVWEDYGVAPPLVPQPVAAWFAVRGFEDRLVPRWTDSVVPHLRTALLPFRPVADSWDLWIPSEYFEELFGRGTQLGNGEAQVRASFEEIHALEPEFLINTGDIVFDSNRVPREVSADWVSLYKEVAERPGRPVYPTIGNHELGYIEHEGVSHDDPKYGPGFFRQNFREIPYSFDKGGFHFIALDTHSPGSGEGHDAWRRNRMRPEVEAWLEADLAESAGRTTVVLNHEPFFEDPDWNEYERFAELELVDDEGLLERFEVDYTMTGHVHLPAMAQEGPTTHISTGALSGMHWLLPPSVFPRGYRLVYARDGRLYSGFKHTGEPLVALADGSGEDEVVAVAADRSGAFARVRLLRDGEPLPSERWGDYFLRAPFDGTGSVAIEATRADGEQLVVELR